MKLFARASQRLTDSFTIGIYDSNMSGESNSNSTPCRLAKPAPALRDHFGGET